jgi:hypothetical protein
LHRDFYWHILVIIILFWIDVALCYERTTVPASASVASLGKCNMRGEIDELSRGPSPWSRDAAYIRVRRATCHKSFPQLVIDVIAENQRLISKFYRNTPFNVYGPGVSQSVL